MMLMTYLAEQKASGKYIRNVEQIRGWYDEKSELSKKDMAKAIRVSLPVFDEVLSFIKEHPEWDDEEVANKTDWRKK